MVERALQYRRVHNLLLIQKHLTLREGASPFTLVLDSLEQSARSLIERYIHNAKISKVDTIYVAYETLRPPAGITHFIKAQRKDPFSIQREIASLMNASKRTLLIIDTLYPVINATAPGPNQSLTLPTFLSALLGVPSTTLLAIHHTDIPLPLPSSPGYDPSPFSLLHYLATTILTCHSFTQTLARKYAAERSQPEPLFGLAEEKEGVIAGLPGLRDGRHSGSERIEGRGRGDTARNAGLVLQAEFRRKSGRAVEEWYFVPDMMTTTTTSTAKKGDDKVILLDDHPSYNDHNTGGGSGAHQDALGPSEGASLGASDTSSSSTFELGLTDRQRKDREGVVLPYFDAQKGVLGEGGEGGRILYDLGVEDDFDEEEDEI